MMIQARLEKRIVILPIVLAFLACTLIACTPMMNYTAVEGPRYTGNYTVLRPDPGMSITVVSYNLELGEDAELALAELSRDPYTEHADLLLLQEMDEIGVELIARTLGYDYVYYPASVHTSSGRNFGNAILSKWPIQADDKIILPHGNLTRGQRRIAVRVVIAYKSLCLQVVSAHTENLSMDQKRRLDQVSTVLEAAAGRPYLSIVGGDFNTIEAPILRETVRRFEAQDYEWSTREAGATATFAIIDVQSDHIFSRGLSVVRSGQISTARASDHKPVWAQLAIAPAFSDSTEAHSGVRPPDCGRQYHPD